MKIEAKPRADLLALGTEDLELFSNRGTVRRAAADLEDAALSCDWEDLADGSFAASWSDGARCVFPASGTLRDARCSCPAASSATSVCRHVVRTALAYRSRFSSRASAAVPEESSVQPVRDTPAKAAAWDPGAIPDEALADAFSGANLSRARALFDEGLLVEVVRQGKPVARIHGLGATVRFLVSGDVRYAKTDCSGAAAEQAAAIAVWAFRLLETGKEAGYVQTGTASFQAPRDLFAETDAALAELYRYGVSRQGATFPGVLRALENRHREAALPWLADILAELALEIERYAARDALFDPLAASDLCAQWSMRRDALEANTGALPPGLVGGTKYDRERELDQSRFTALGCEVRRAAKSVSLIAYLVDEDTLSILTVEREFAAAEEERENARPFSVLADASVAKGIRLADLAGGRVISAGGKRTAAGKVTLGRKLAVSPQTFSWERLRDGFLEEDFAALAFESADAPPPQLRSRRRGEDFRVLRITSAGEAGFDTAAQELRFAVRDQEGREALVVLPWEDRSAAGFERLVSLLQDPSSRPIFVGGRLSIGAEGLAIRPVSVVFEKDGARTMVQPWIDAAERGSGGAASAESGTEKRQGNEEAGARRENPHLRRMIASIQEAAAETILIGAEGKRGALSVQWETVARSAEAAGSTRLSKLASDYAATLARNGRRLDADSGAEEKLLLELLSLASLGASLTG